MVRCKMSIEIRPAFALDIDRVMALELENFSVPWPRDGFVYELLSDDSLFFVAAQGDAVAGFVVLRLADEEAELYNIAVDAVCRGRGIGGLLLDSVLNEAAKRRVQSVYLEVRASNEAAKRLYISRGFEAVGLRRGYYDKPKEDAIVMVKTLLTEI